MANIWRIKTTEEANSELCLKEQMICIGWPPYMDDELYTTIVSEKFKFKSVESTYIDTDDEHTSMTSNITATSGITANSGDCNQAITLEEIEKEFIAINTYEAYEAVIAKYGLYSGPQHKGRKSSVNTFANKMQAGDYVWLKYKSQYYVGQIRDDKLIFKYNQEQAILDDKHDYMRRYVQRWVHMGDESKVPGAVVRAFAFRGSTVQRIVDGEAAVKAYLQFFLDRNKAEHSEFLPPYNETNFYEEAYSYVMKLDESILEEASIYEAFKKQFFALLGTDDCEDLLCFLLYYTYGYIPWPSTNKRNMATYECILLDPKQVGKEIYIQVKSGTSQILQPQAYEDLIALHDRNEVYLFNVSDQYGEPSKYNQIHMIGTDEIFKDLLSKRKNGRGEILLDLVSARIIYWLAIAYKQFVKKF